MSIAAIRPVITKGYEWAQKNGVLSIALTVAKVTALSAAIFAVGCVVTTIITGSLPALTFSAVVNGSFYLILGTTNFSCCVRLFKKILHPKSISSWKEIAGLVATIAITNFIGFYSITFSASEALTIAFRMFNCEIGLITNLAMGARIANAVKRALDQKSSVKNLIKEVAIGTVFSFGACSLMNATCLGYPYLDFHDLSSVTAVIAGSGAIAGLTAKIGSVIRKTKISPITQSK